MHSIYQWLPTNLVKCLIWWVIFAHRYANQWEKIWLFFNDYPPNSSFALFGVHINEQKSVNSSMITHQFGKMLGLVGNYRTLECKPMNNNPLILQWSPTSRCHSAFWWVIFSRACSANWILYACGRFWSCSAKQMDKWILRCRKRLFTQYFPINFFWQWIYDP